MVSKNLKNNLFYNLCSMSLSHLPMFIRSQTRVVKNAPSARDKRWTYGLKILYNIKCI
jgi:hypothetical protein